MQYAKDFNADRANLVAANAAVSAGVLEAATDFDFDKAHGLEYGDSPSSHAMTITGVNLDEQGKPNRWNSIHGSRSPSVAADITCMKRSRGWDCSHGFPVPLC